MPNRFVSGAGSNSSPYGTWATAAASLATAITGSAAGDVFVIDAASPGANVAANTTWTFLGNATVIASTNTGTSTITPTTMGTATWLGHDTVSFSLTTAGAFRVYWYGVTFRTAASGLANLSMNTSDAGHFEFDTCYFWLGTVASSSVIGFGNNTAGGNHYTVIRNSTLRLSQVAQTFRVGGAVDIFGGTLAGTNTTALVGAQNNSTSLRFFGSDLSLNTNTLVASQSGSSAEFSFSQCRFGAAVTVMAAQTPANKSSARVSVFDCASGDTHGLFGYYDAFGNVVSNTSIFLTAGAAAQSWRIDTTANCSYSTPFITPTISRYHTGTAAITPSLEILRDGSTTAYNNAQVWGEFSAKTTAGSTRASFQGDQQALVDWAAGTAGVAQATGLGTGAWTGGTTPWSGKVDSGATMTPAEFGHITGRVVVGAPSITVYVDPQIRIA